MASSAAACSSSPLLTRGCASTSSPGGMEEAAREEKLQKDDAAAASLTTITSPTSPATALSATTTSTTCCYNRDDIVRFRRLCLSESKKLWHCPFQASGAATSSQTTATPTPSIKRLPCPEELVTFRLDVASSAGGTGGGSSTSGASNNRHKATSASSTFTAASRSRSMASSSANKNVMTSSYMSGKGVGGMLLSPSATVPRPGESNVLSLSCATPSSSGTSVSQVGAIGTSGAVTSETTAGLLPRPPGPDGLACSGSASMMLSCTAEADILAPSAMRPQISSVAAVGASAILSPKAARITPSGLAVAPSAARRDRPSLLLSDAAAGADSSHAKDKAAAFRATLEEGLLPTPPESQRAPLSQRFPGYLPTFPPSPFLGPSWGGGDLIQSNASYPVSILSLAPAPSPSPAGAVAGTPAPSSLTGAGTNAFSSAATGGEGKNECPQRNSGALLQKSALADLLAQHPQLLQHPLFKSVQGLRPEEVLAACLETLAQAAGSRLDALSPSTSALPLTTKQSAQPKDGSLKQVSGVKSTKAKKQETVRGDDPKVPFEKLSKAPSADKGKNAEPAKAASKKSQKKSATSTGGTISPSKSLNPQATEFVPGHFNIVDSIPGATELEKALASINEQHLSQSSCTNNAPLLPAQGWRQIVSPLGASEPPLFPSPPVAQQPALLRTAHTGLTTPTTLPPDVKISKREFLKLLKCLIDNGCNLQEAKWSKGEDLFELEELLVTCPYPQNSEGAGEAAPEQSSPAAAASACPFQKDTSTRSSQQNDKGDEIDSFSLADQKDRRKKKLNREKARKAISEKLQAPLSEEERATILEVKKSFRAAADGLVPQSVIGSLIVPDVTCRLSKVMKLSPADVVRQRMMLRRHHIGVLVSSMRQLWTDAYCCQPSGGAGDKTAMGGVGRKLKGTALPPLEVCLEHFAFPKLKQALLEITSVVVDGSGGNMRVIAIKHWQKFIGEMASPSPLLATSAVDAGKPQSTNEKADMKRKPLIAKKNASEAKGKQNSPIVTPS